MAREVALPVGATRFVPPAPRPGLIERAGLLEAQGTGRSQRVMVVRAPAGYGKTTFAAQWCRRDHRPVAWLTLREADNDGIRLLARVHGALESIEPLDPITTDLVRRPGAHLGDLLVRFVDTLERRTPVLLVLDDVYVVRTSSAEAVLRALCDMMPVGAQVVLVTREHLPAGLARLRVAGDVHEVGAADLAFDLAEIEQVFANAGLDTAPEQVARLAEQTEGWAAAVVLAAMSAQREPATGAQPLPNVVGPDVADYFLDEVLALQPDDLRHFLLATSVTQRLCGPLCDAITGRHDSARVLRDLEQRNLFVVPLSDQRKWYRYHHLFGELLQAELAASGLDVDDLLNRAAAWHEAYGEPAEAFEYARRAGDMVRAGRVLLRRWDAYAAHGQIETPLLWLDRCTDDQIESDPQLAIAGSWISIMVGQGERAHRYLAFAERSDLDAPSSDGASSLRAAMVNLRATLAPAGVTQMLSDSLAVVESEALGRSRWLLGGYWKVGLAQMQLGRSHEAVGTLRDAVRLTDGQPALRYVRLLCLGVSALAHIDVSEWDAAESCAAHGDELFEDFDATIQSMPLLVAQAVLRARGGDREGAMAALAKAREAMPLVHASHCFHAELALRCAEAAHAVNDDDLARDLLDDARFAVTRAVDAGTLPARIDDLSARITDLDPYLRLLTPAEMRVLRQLATHRKLKEIGEQLYISRATVKTHVAAIYQKLGVTSRAEAIAALGSRGADDLRTLGD